MKCAACKNTAKVTQTRETPGGVRRRHHCLTPGCGVRFSTFEVVITGRAEQSGVPDACVSLILRGKTHPELNRAHEVAHLLGRKYRATGVR